MYNNKKEDNIKKRILSWHEYEKQNISINNEINKKEDQLIKLSKQLAIKQNLINDQNKILRNEYNVLKENKLRLERRIKTQIEKKAFFTNHVSSNNYSFIISNQMTIIDKTQTSTDLIFEIVKDVISFLTDSVEKEVLNSRLNDINLCINKVIDF